MAQPGALSLRYASATGKKYHETIVIDLYEHKGSYQLGKPNLYSTAQSLEKIQHEISKIACGSRHIRTDVYTSDDRKAERAAIFEGLNREHSDDQKGSN